MAGPPNKDALKQQALLTLEQSRRSITAGITTVREKLNPRMVLEKTVRQHALLTLTGALAGGFLASRMLFSSKSENRRDTQANSVRKRRSIGSILLSSAWSLAREPLLALAAQKVLPLAMHYLDKHQTPSGSTQTDSIE